MPRKNRKWLETAIAPERIEKSILLIRGEKVILDAELAKLYGVETKTLVRAVKRNADRFPPDFAYQLTSKEFTILRYQFGTSSWGGRRTPPYVFTEHGVAMLSSVLGSPQAIAVNIAIIRAFVRLRELMASHKQLTQRLDELEKKYDGQFKTVFEVIRQLISPESTSRREMGFHTTISKK